jgi:prepilin-type N-terminal cleavage/methylation domain-containing protein
MKFYQSNLFKDNDGFTAIELILVIAIVAILGATTTPFLINFYQRNNLEVATDTIIGSIRKAQNYAINNKDTGNWGVCLSGTKIRLFRGTCAAPTFSEQFDKSSSVTITGLNETTFSKARGEPSAPLSINVSNSIGSYNINVNNAGGLDLIKN